MYLANISFKHIKPLKPGLVSFRIAEDTAGTGQTVSSLSPVNFLETEEDYLLLVNAAGMSREDLSVTIEQGIITIRTNRKNNPNKPVCFLKECCIDDIPDWTRVFILPEDADMKRTDATYKNGELYIHIPRGLPAQNKVSSEVCVD